MINTRELENNHYPQSITTGLRCLDKLTNGLNNSALVMVAACPGTGKTAFALNMSQAVNTAGNTVLLFSLETAKHKLVNRFLSMGAGSDLQRINTEYFSESDIDQLDHANNSCSDVEIYIDDSALTVSEMTEKCRKLKAAKGLGLVIVDYVQLMTTNEHYDTRQQEDLAIAKGLRQLVNEAGCPVVVLSQLPRKLDKRKDCRPVLSDLKKSEALQQEADLIILLHRDKAYGKTRSSKNGKFEIMIAKNRNGLTGTTYATWNDKYGIITEKSRLRCWLENIFFLWG